MFIFIKSLFNLFLSVIFLFSIKVWGKEIRTFSLEEAQKLALKNSIDVRLADAYIEEISQKIKVVKSNQYPKLNLEAQHTNIGVVPEFSTPAGKVKLGDNRSYSIGPSLTYKLFDGGVIRNTIQSLQKLNNSQLAEKEYVEIMAILSVRLAYLSVLIDEEQLLLSRESLALSKSQNEDIKRKRKLGALSQLDLSLSERDVLNQELKVMEANVQLKKSVSNLRTLVLGSHEKSNYFLPMSLASESENVVKYDSLEAILSFLENQKVNSSVTPAQVKAIDLKLASTKKDIEIQKSKYWPQVSLKMRSSLDYPNGPQLKQINQKSLSVNLIFPLYDWGERSGNKGEKMAKLKLLELKKDKVLREINLNKENLRMDIENLKLKEKIVNQLVVKAKEVSKINLKSFKSGRIQFTEVERSNVKKFEALVQSLIIKGQIFSKLSQYLAITTGGVHE